MFAIARGVLRPSFARALASPAASASLHTLPDLPYAYNVCVVIVRDPSEIHIQFPLGS